MSERGSWNPWPWVPAIVLAVAVVANVVLIRLALNNQDERVDRPAEVEPVGSDVRP